MDRRLVRLRQEYLHRKNLEGKEKTSYERKLALREALRQGKSIPNELKNDGLEVFDQVDAEDEWTSKLRDPKMDEYSASIKREPKILITTSRKPSSRLKKFAKEMKLVFPESVRVNRGGMVLKDLVTSAITNDFTDIVLFHEHRGNPDTMIISHLPHGPTASFSMKNCVLRHDVDKKEIGQMSTAYPRLIFDNFSNSIGERVTNILRFLFPTPKITAKRVITFANRGDYISFRNHGFKKRPPSDVELSELGPRFELRLYQIALGGLETRDPTIEWVLRPYMNTAKKRKVLSG
ncbi:hypothetical protein MHBO_001747 [Bonamia ostreae]|uniref:Brix domain-containing protein n=1 Tax=Bonamia ostreae TaxID=126728 RepID=A0ABV2AL51_9EUKA